MTHLIKCNHVKIFGENIDHLSYGSLSRVCSHSMEEEHNSNWAERGKKKKSEIILPFSFLPQSNKHFLTTLIRPISVAFSRQD